jgi:hypothetical protein
MTEYCIICNSIMVSGNCTNSKCRKHIRTGQEPITLAQEQYIRDLCRKLEIDVDDEYGDFKGMTKYEASVEIDELLKNI